MSCDLTIMKLGPSNTSVTLSLYLIHFGTFHIINQMKDSDF